MTVVFMILIAALVATVIAMSIGLMSMAGGGSADRRFSEPLMWARVGLQALTVVLLVIAIALS